ncbi:MAG: ferritin family protein [Desulfobacterales bacterium]|nr:ferritin family protein [Desulfobacterales bacterium]
MFTLNDLFDIAVKMEENGKSVYLLAMKETSDPKLLELLQWMAEEEDCHCHWFLNQKKTLPSGSEDLAVMLPDVIAEMMGENSLSLDEVDFSLIDTPAKMVKTFIMFENDTILFYEFLETFIDDPITREGLKGIIREENAHVEKLTLMLETFS